MMSELLNSQPTQYEIRVSGALAPERALWFGELALTVEHTASGTSITILSGPVADRAALFGILNRIRDLGLTLISVNPTVTDSEGAADDAETLVLL